MIQPIIYHNHLDYIYFGILRRRYSYVSSDQVAFCIHRNKIKNFILYNSSQQAHLNVNSSLYL